MLALIDWQALRLSCRSICSHFLGTFCQIQTIPICTMLVSSFFLRPVLGTLLACAIMGSYMAPAAAVDPAADIKDIKDIIPNCVEDPLDVRCCYVKDLFKPRVYTVDIMVLYSPQAMCAHAGIEYENCDVDNMENHRAIREEAQRNILVANEAFFNSNINIRLRLPPDCLMMDPIGYGEDEDDDSVDSIEAIREDLVDNRKDVHCWRDACRADVVGYFIDRTYDAYGEANGIGGDVQLQGDYPDYETKLNAAAAYFLVSRDSPSDQNVFTHELGHTLGGQHNHAFCHTTKPCFKTMMRARQDNEACHLESCDCLDETGAVILNSEEVERIPFFSSVCNVYDGIQLHFPPCKDTATDSINEMACAVSVFGGRNLMHFMAQIENRTIIEYCEEISDEYEEVKDNTFTVSDWCEISVDPLQPVNGCDEFPILCSPDLCEAFPYLCSPFKPSITGGFQRPILAGLGGLGSLAGLLFLGHRRYIRTKIASSSSLKENLNPSVETSIH